MILIVDLLKEELEEFQMILETCDDYDMNEVARYAFDTVYNAIDSLLHPEKVKEERK